MDRAFTAWTIGMFEIENENDKYDDDDVNDDDQIVKKGTSYPF